MERKKKKIKQNSRKPGRLKDETENHQREKSNHQAMMNNKRKQLI